MTGMEAVTVRTCPQALQAVNTHLVDVDAVNLGGLESAWTWSQAGQHQVCALSGAPSLLLYQRRAHV